MKNHSIPNTNSKQIQKIKSIGQFLKENNELQPLSLRQFCAKQEYILNLKKILRLRMMFRDISDFYTPTKLIGRGASSKVYLVKDKNNDQIEYACKCIDKAYLCGEDGYEALYSEIQYMNQLNHPCIIQLYEVFEGDNTFYMILEYLKGKNLHEIIHQQKLLNGFSFDQISIIMKQILEALAFIHSKNIMHRDLKPENIMFYEPDNLKTLKIVDFGLATSTLVSVYQFAKCGTPGYVAPEIANLKDPAQKYDSVCDVFSAGCIFYKLITLKDLFPGCEHQEILALNKKCIITLTNLPIYKPPPAAIQLIRRMLCVTPNERITASESLINSFFITNNQSIPADQKKCTYQQKSQKEKTSKTDGFIENGDQFQQENFQLSILSAINNQTQQQQQDFEDGEVIADESPKLHVPVLKHHQFKIGSFVMKQDLRNGQTEKIKQIKKTGTSDFEENNNYQFSPLTKHHPSFVMKNSQSNQKQIISDQVIKSPQMSDSSKGASSPISPYLLQKLYENNVINASNVIIENYEDEESVRESGIIDSQKFNDIQKVESLKNIVSQLKKQASQK